MPTSKTSSSSILVPKTIIPLVSMMGLGLRSSFWVVFFLQSRMRVMVCLCTLMATRCHLKREVKLIHTRTGLHAAHLHTTSALLRAPFVFSPSFKFKYIPLCFSGVKQNLILLFLQSHFFVDANINLDYACKQKTPCEDTAIHI